MKSTSLLPFVLLIESAATANVIPDVRAAIAQNDFEAGEALLERYKAERGVTPEMLEALSWMARGSLAAKKLDAADRYAEQTYRLAAEQLKARKLDDEKHLPIALGAAIEVRGQAMAQRGERSGAVEYLRNELAKYHGASIRTRIQKNIHLLSLEGKPAPALELGRYLGPKPETLAALKGKPLLLFFWAHWCGDCKNEAPVLAQIRKEFAADGLVLLAPTQRYGYVSRGQEAGPEKELEYIESVRQRYYSVLLDAPAPVSEENFRSYGASTTPTLVLVDRAGIVRTYHPGKMTYEELAPLVRQAVSAARAARSSE